MPLLSKYWTAQWVPNMGQDLPTLTEHTIMTGYFCLSCSNSLLNFYFGTSVDFVSLLVKHRYPWFVMNLFQFAMRYNKCTSIVCLLVGVWAHEIRLTTPLFTEVSEQSHEIEGSCICVLRCRRDRDRMVVGFTTTYAISAYHHWCCEIESRSGRGLQNYVIKFVNDFLRVLRFHPPIKLTTTI